MEAGFILAIIVIAAVGIIIGFLLGKTHTDLRYKRDTQFTQGTLNVDCSDPEFEPGLFLGLAVPIKNVIERKHITLDVNVMSQNSHK